MSCALFLDDERFPPADGRDWVIVRSVSDAIAWVGENGVPSYVSFDNDLGGALEGYDFARWLCERDMDADVLPADFGFYVHSQNAARAPAIRDLLEAHLRHRAAEQQAGRPWPPGAGDPWATLPEQPSRFR